MSVMAAPKARVAAAILVVAAAVALTAPPAEAHGPVAPAASSYLASVTQLPAGLQAKVIDGDQRLWLRVPAGETVVVLDYRGAPYLRFAAGSVEVNRNSALYYLNQPVAAVPPAGLTARTPPSWQRAGGGREFSWHDGRLHALASVARLPGQSNLGGWRIPLTVDGRASAVSGTLRHAPRPSWVWFWWVVVLLACAMAAQRVRRPTVDAVATNGLAAACLLATSFAAVGRQLHGRPAVSALQLVELAAILAFVGWAVRRLLLRRAGYFVYFLVGFVALWQGAVLLDVLLNGFVLIAVPAFTARVATVVLLGSGLGLVMCAFRMSGEPRGRGAPATAVGAALSALLLAACGSEQPRAQGSELPAALVAQARPIGRGAQFHPPVSGRTSRDCRPALSRRIGAHVEVFAANQVVIIPAGIGVQGPVVRSAGRIVAARCFADLVTVEPTGVVLVRPGRRTRLADLFRAWGQPLSRRRLAGFSASHREQVTVFVDGRVWAGAPGAVPLTRHAEIVLEVGPRVPPHAAYTFPPGT